MEAQRPKNPQTAQPGQRLMNIWSCLKSRHILRLSGTQARPFLHGLVTQDLMQDQAVWFAALLTPQGRFLADFFVIPHGHDLLLDVAKDHVESVLKVLSPLAVFHDVHLSDDLGHWAVCAGLGPEIASILPPSAPLTGHEAFFYADPRKIPMGVRALVPYRSLVDRPHPLLLAQNEQAYHRYRWAQCVAEGAYDLVTNRSIILEYGYDALGALSWTKGCYMGQELMARTHHLGHVRKKPYCVWSSVALPEKGTALWKEGQRLGMMGGSVKERDRWMGLAILDGDCVQAPLVHASLQEDQLPTITLHIIETSKMAQNCGQDTSAS